ncbi:MAG: DUF1801 domain-containing protein [Candidatus Hydrogenedentes bacterium]|nr:DUF1801 domain-containing protein [Candidatus Hydrogenedentota bacterium]
MKTHTTIDSYIAAQPGEVQPLLQALRSTIQKQAPDAEEAIAYGMPTFRLNGNLVHFAACANHIGFYPTPSAICEFQESLSKYKTSKGAIQFPIDKKLPLALIGKMVRFRVKENLAKKKK